MSTAANFEALEQWCYENNALDAVDVVFFSKLVDNLDDDIFPELAEEDDVEMNWFFDDDFEAKLAAAPYNWSANAQNAMRDHVNQLGTDSEGSETIINTFVAYLQATYIALSAPY